MISELRLRSFFLFYEEQCMFIVEYVNGLVLQNPRSMTALLHSIPLSLCPLVQTGSVFAGIVPSLFIYLFILPLLR